MRDLDLNPHEVLKAIEDSVQASRPHGDETAELRASNAAKLVLRSAFHHASRAGRQASSRLIWWPASWTRARRHR